MVRLTQKEASGNWQVKGLPWEKLQKGETISEETRQILYGCLCKLKDYEDTGRNPDQIAGLQNELKDMAESALEEIRQYQAIGTVEECREAREKQIPKKPAMNQFYYFCLDCGACRSIRQKHLFCHDCGQKLDWSVKPENG